jgi:cytochrome c biogenesis protein CcdA
MIVLLGFALLAGAGTALSPCVLPVLPALLSAGGVGGARRPLGIVLGLSITFTVTIVGVAQVVDGVGLGSNPLRGVAIAVLLAFGLALLMPRLSARLEAPLSRLARFGPRTAGDGFLSGLLVGGALGFLYTPCASPILAAVISVGAASGRTVAIALAYAAGSALVLLALTLGGPRAGAARRPSDPRVGGGRGRPRQHRDRAPAAPLHARLARPQRTAPPHPALRTGCHGLRVHVRVGACGAGTLLSSPPASASAGPGRAGALHVSGIVDLPRPPARQINKMHDLHGVWVTCVVRLTFGAPDPILVARTLKRRLPRTSCESLTTRNVVP